MSGELDTRPDLVEQIQVLRDKVRDLESRVSGDESGLDLSDLNDVRVDSLGDGTITLSDGSALVFRAADKLWVPGGSSTNYWQYGVTTATTLDLDPTTTSGITAFKVAADTQVRFDAPSVLLRSDEPGYSDAFISQGAGMAAAIFSMAAESDSAGPLGGASAAVFGTNNSAHGQVTIGANEPDTDGRFVQVFFYGTGAVVQSGLVAAPDSAQLGPSEFGIWLDATPGSAKLMVKAKDSAGTVVTGQLALA